MKIFISQHYSRNKGNVSLLFTLVEAIKNQFPDADIIVSSFDPIDTRKTFGYNTCEWPFITRKIVDAKKLNKLITAFTEVCFVTMYAFFAILIRFKIIKASNLKGRFVVLKEIQTSNIIISPGGHLFTNYNKIVPVFAHFFPCFLSFVMKKPFVVMAQTIGPFFGIWKVPAQLMTKFVLKNADIVTIRDSNSFENISKLNVKIKDIRQTNELVFLYPGNNSVNESRTTNKLGFTFHHIYYKRWMTKEDYVGKMVNFINKVNQDFNFEILFISMEKTIENKSDIPLLKEIRSKLDNQSNIEIVTISKSSNELLSVFESLNFLIATKTHSVVYGLLKCIPTLAIAYEKKTDDFMACFNQEDLSIPLSEFEVGDAFARFERMVKREVEIKNTIKENLVSVQSKALENINLLMKYT